MTLDQTARQDQEAIARRTPIAKVGIIAREDVDGKMHTKGWVFDTRNCDRGDVSQMDDTRRHYAPDAEVAGTGWKSLDLAQIALAGRGVQELARARGRFLMGTYVDDMELPADVPNGAKVVSSKWSHLTADTHEELMQAAKALHLSPRWIQYPGTYKEHFDLTSGKRQQAIGKGIAEPITIHEAGQKMLAAHAKVMDRKAGEAFKAGELDKAQEILARAQRLFPDQSDLWASRLDAITDKAMREDRSVPADIDAASCTGCGQPSYGAPEHACCAAWKDVIAAGNPCPSCQASRYIGGKQGKPPANIPYLPAGQVPTVAVDPARPSDQREQGNYPVAKGPRAPEPPPGHYCPGCTSITERDGRLIYNGPKTAESRELCQGCEVLISIGREPPQMTADCRDSDAMAEHDYLERMASDREAGQ